MPILYIVCVLCFAVAPIYVGEHLKIAGHKDNKICVRSCCFAYSIHYKELSHFIRQANGKISLVHKSLAAYLTDNTRKTEQFFVSKGDGCRLLAKYLLNRLPTSKEQYIVTYLYSVFYVFIRRLDNTSVSICSYRF